MKSDARGGQSQTEGVTMQWVKGTHRRSKTHRIRVRERHATRPEAQVVQPPKATTDLKRLMETTDWQTDWQGKYLTYFLNIRGMFYVITSVWHN